MDTKIRAQKVNPGVENFPTAPGESVDQSVCDMNMTVIFFTLQHFCNHVKI